MQYKPGVHRKTHLLLAASLWSIIGTMLSMRGVDWLLEVDKLWFILPAMAAGIVKSLLILDKTARKGVARILKLADGTCLGAVYSWKTWILVFCMMGMGHIFRHSSLPREFLGFLYVFIGTALFFSSRFAWRAWLLRQWLPAKKRSNRR